MVRPVAASARSPAEKQPRRRDLAHLAVPRGTVWRSRAAREAARATPQLAAAPVPPVAGEQRPQAEGCKAADLQRERNQFFVMSATASLNNGLQKGLVRIWTRVCQWRVAGGSWTIRGKG